MRNDTLAKWRWPWIGWLPTRFRLFGPFVIAAYALAVSLPLTVAAPAGAQSGGYGSGGYSGGGYTPPSYGAPTYSGTTHRTKRGASAATALPRPIWRPQGEEASHWRNSISPRGAPTISGMTGGPSYTKYSGYYGAYTVPGQEAEKQAPEDEKPEETAKGEAKTAEDSKAAEKLTR